MLENLYEQADASVPAAPAGSRSAPEADAPASKEENTGTDAEKGTGSDPGEAIQPVSFESNAPIGYEVGQQLADFTTPTFDGGEFRLSDKRGKIVIINLWATYCTPCVQELPEFEALLREHEEADLHSHRPLC